MFTHSVKPSKTWINNFWLVNSTQLHKPDAEVKARSVGHDWNYNIDDIT